MTGTVLSILLTTDLEFSLVRGACFAQRGSKVVQLETSTLRQRARPGFASPTTPSGSRVRASVEAEFASGARLRNTDLAKIDLDGFLRRIVRLMPADLIRTDQCVCQTDCKDRTALLVLLHKIHRFKVFPGDNTAKERRATFIKRLGRVERQDHSLPRAPATACSGSSLLTCAKRIRRSTECAAAKSSGALETGYFDSNSRLCPGALLL